MAYMLFVPGNQVSDRWAGHNTHSTRLVQQSAMEIKIEPQGQDWVKEAKVFMRKGGDQLQISLSFLSVKVKPVISLL